MQNNIYYKIDSKYICHDISSKLLKIYKKDIPIIVCLGSDKVLSDMVGVFVADILKKLRIPTYVFGGTYRTANKNVAQILSKKISSKRLLFVDSGILSEQNSVAITPQTILNNGSVIYPPCIVCGTIKQKSGVVELAQTKFTEVLRYSKIVANSILDYISYVEILSGKRCF